MAKKPVEKSVTESPVEVLPVLPLRDIVVFPHMIVPLFVGREKSIKALEEVMREDKRIVLVAQKNPPMMIRRRMPSTKSARWPR
jgi:ATP-dependent Lon protease